MTRTIPDESAKPKSPGAEISRREFVRTCALGATLLASGALTGCATTKSSKTTGAAALILPLDQDWLFGGKFVDGADTPVFDDSKFSRVALPHCVTKLSWQGWKPEDWQDVWIYRRHFQVPKEFRDRRIFVEFDRVM